MLTIQISRKNQAGEHSYFLQVLDGDGEVILHSYPLVSKEEIIAYAEKLKSDGLKWGVFWACGKEDDLDKFFKQFEEEKDNLPIKWDPPEEDPSSVDQTDITGWPGS